MFPAGPWMGFVPSPVPAGTAHLDLQRGSHGALQPQKFIQLFIQIGLGTRAALETHWGHWAGLGGRGEQGGLGEGAAAAMGCRSCCAPAQTHWAPGQGAQLGQGLRPASSRGSWADRDGNAKGAWAKGSLRRSCGAAGLWGNTRGALGWAGTNWDGLGSGGHARGETDSDRTRGTHQRRVRVHVHTV